MVPNEIRNDDQLRVVREQLLRAEQASLTIECEIKPINPRTFAVMAEPYEETIETLRRLVTNFRSTIS